MVLVVSPTFPFFHSQKLASDKNIVSNSIIHTMSSSIKNLAFLALATGLASVSSAQSTSGSGTTTRYWYT
jgi:hypothetical protein